MASTSGKVLVALLVMNMLQVFFSTAEAQVTFSRDWKAGKRSAGGDCRGFPPTASICHMLINELKAAASCEAVSLLRRRAAESSPGEDLLDTVRQLPVDRR